MIPPPEVEASQGPGTSPGTEAEALQDAGPTLAYLRDWSVSPTGSDSSAGTSAQPFRTITRALAAASAGERILVNAGTYPERVRIGGTVRAGTSTQPIRLQGVNMPKIVPPSTGSGALLGIEKPYWQVDGFEVDVQSKPFYAAYFTGTVTGSVLSHSHLHHGTSGTGVSTHYACVGATIEDNEIDHFQRAGDDSHGILVQPGSRQITIRRNVVHDNSGDSIQCIGPEDLSSEPPADGVLIEGNTMYHDYEQAVDVKTCSNVTIRGNLMRDYLESPGGCTMVVHMSASEVLIEGNEFRNVGKAIAIGGNHYGPVPYHVVVKRNRFRNVVRGMVNGSLLEGVGVRLENSQSARIFNNTFVDVDYAAIMAGGGDQGATSDLMIKDNLITTLSTTAYGIYLGGYMNGLLSRNNLFAPGTMFSALSSSGSRQTVTFTGWKSLTGQDAPSRQSDPQLNPDTLVPGLAAVDWGEYVGIPYCGPAPDVGAVETGCTTAL